MVLDCQKHNFTFCNMLCPSVVKIIPAYIKPGHFTGFTFFNRKRQKNSEIAPT